jgi:translation initiation factor 1
MLVRRADRHASADSSIANPTEADHDVMSGKKRIDTSASQNLGHNPFATLSSAGLPPGSESATVQPAQPVTVKPVEPRKKRGRVDILRETAHRGGKTVTVVTHFVGIGLPEKEKLAKAMQKACGTGGTVKDGRIEIQGDQRAVVTRILTEAGFQPVFAGG